MKLAGVLETAGILQFRDHARLGLIRGRDTVDETFRPLGYVERLEHVFVVDVLVENHLDSSSARYCRM